MAAPHNLRRRVSQLPLTGIIAGNRGITIKRVIVAMSGGVDSSVAAALLKEQGYHVTGATMKIRDGETSAEEGRSHGCYGPDKERDIEDSRKVAGILGIDWHVFDLSREYKAEVLDYFSGEYRAGRTPNPCLRCNRSLKFGALLGKARKSGIEFDYFATGHYARVEYDSNRRRYLLRKAADPEKDQSYFISSLSQEQLGSSLFPVGGYRKEEVMKMASGLGLGLENKPESQDFIAGGYASVLEEATPGKILDREGNTLGEHRGIQFYTIGQRRGVGISTGEPVYVTRIDPDRNTITVGVREEIYKDELTASGLNWIAVEKLSQPVEATVKIRYAHEAAAATVTPLSEDSVRVKFREPQMAITPGQAVVFYDEDIVIGNGTIERAD